MTEEVGSEARAKIFKNSWGVTWRAVGDDKLEASWKKCQKYELPGLPPWLSGKESACNGGAVGDVGSIPGLERSPGGGHGNPLQYSCLENPMDRGAWRLQSIGVTKSRTRLKRLSTHAGMSFQGVSRFKKEEKARDGSGHEGHKGQYRFWA